MDISQISERVRRIQSQIGPRGYISFGIGGDTAAPCHIYLKPGGLTGEGPVKFIDTSTPDDALEQAEQWLKDIAGSLHVETVRKMAMAIITATDENGACTTASLRIAGFSEDEIARHGEEAVAKADEMAGRGPFAILDTAAANAA